MLRTKKQAESDDGPSAPMWMLTFSDCMTLLLTFFVLLVTFSSFGEEVLGGFPGLAGGFRKAFHGPGQPEPDKSAFLPTGQIWAKDVLDQGSEKPTLATGQSGTLKENTETVDFHSRKVFLIPSKRVFLGKGTALSSEGRTIMTLMALFLKAVPGRIVISENGPQQEETSKYLGLPRAWAVLEYLTKQQNLDKKKFSISATTTIHERRETRLRPEGLKPEGDEGREERMLEIILLERSIYN